MDTLKIDNIIVKSFSGQASEEEGHYLKTWLDLSGANKKYYDHVVHVLETLKNEKADEFEIPDIDGEWERLKSSVHHKQKRKNLVFLRVAAIFMVILGTSFLFMYNSSPVKPKQKQVAEVKKQAENPVEKEVTADIVAEVKQVPQAKEEYSTDADSRELALTDNSRVILDANSNFIFKNGQNLRKAYLDGSGVFHVNHLDNKDFLLSTKDLEVHVVGTIFEISQSGKKKIDIFVEEGQIEVFSKLDKSKKQVISAGESYTYYVKKDEFQQKNTHLIKLKFKGLRSKFQHFFIKK